MGKLTKTKLALATVAAYVFLSPLIAAVVFMIRIGLAGAASEDVEAALEAGGA